MIDPELFPAEASRTDSLRLFCFPHAGGGTSGFYRWRKLAGNRVNIVPVRLPGRETRLQVPPAESMSALAETVVDTISSLPAGPYALLGYSFGAHLAHQVARRLPRLGERAPQALVVVASNGPGTPGGTTAKISPPIDELPDEQLVEHIHQKYGGIPAVVRNDPDWLAAFVPALRADLRMLRTQTFDTCEPLNCPLLAIGGLNDQYVTAAGLSNWTAVTRGTSMIRQFPGGHFFLYQDFNSFPSGVAGQAAESLPSALATVFEFVGNGKLSDDGE